MEVTLSDAAICMNCDISDYATVVALLYWNPMVLTRA